MQGLQRKYKSGGCVDSTPTYDPRYYASSRWHDLVEYFNRERNTANRHMSLLESVRVAAAKRAEDRRERAEEKKVDEMGIFGRTKRLVSGILGKFKSSK